MYAEFTVVPNLYLILLTGPSQTQEVILFIAFSVKIVWYAIGDVTEAWSMSICYGTGCRSKRLVTN